MKGAFPKAPFKVVRAARIAMQIAKPLPMLRVSKTIEAPLTYFVMPSMVPLVIR